MKNKKTFLMTIATLLLCIGVMLTGIYAAKTALLKVGGTLGFNMHNAIVEVSGTICNVAEKQISGSYVKTTKTISNAIMGGEKSDTSVTTTELDLGSLEFYTGEDMIFNLTFKNLSSYSVIGSFGIEYSNTKVTQVESGSYDTLPSTKLISIGGTATLNFALHLSDETAVMDGFAFTITANFEELEIKGDSSTGYYLEMGEYEEVPLKWYPFAKLDNNGNVTCKLSDSTFSYKEELTAGSYYFISEKILKIMAFNSSGYSGTAEDNYGLDYNGSDVQTYITGDMLTEYKISNDMLYKAITKRTLPGEGYGIISTSTYLVTNDTPNQSLWLLSVDEQECLEDTENTPASTYGYTLEGNQEYWWLRSPSAIESTALLVNASYNEIYDWYYSTDLLGVRPAFLINIG